MQFYFNLMLIAIFGDSFPNHLQVDSCWLIYKYIEATVNISPTYTIPHVINRNVNKNLNKKGNKVQTNYVNKLCQQIMSTNYVNKLCQQIMSTNYVTKLCHQIMSPNYVNKM